MQEQYTDYTTKCPRGVKEQTQTFKTSHTCESKINKTENLPIKSIECFRANFRPSFLSTSRLSCKRKVIHLNLELQYNNKRNEVTEDSKCLQMLL